jgi:hypothetical protein
MAKQQSPYPPNWTPLEFSDPTKWTSPAYAEALVQISLADQCNLGEVNGFFTQAQFDKIWAESFGDSGLPFSKQATAYQAAVKAAGIGTLPPGPAGTYVNE